MGNKKVGRPKLPVVVAAKKIVLTGTQKQYAKMLRAIEVDLDGARHDLRLIDDKISKLQEERRIRDAERQNLEGTKKNLEGLLSQNPPLQWKEFTQQIINYHYHYHQVHTCCGSSCPCHHTYYINPWWHYYTNGNFITYPTQSQIIITSTFGTPAMTNGGFTDGNLNDGSYVSSSLNNVVNSSNGSLSFVAATQTTLTNTSADPVVFLNIPSNAEDIDASTRALQSVGFFDVTSPVDFKASPDNYNLNITDSL